MKFFLDTADLAEIEEAASWGALAGVTTNPTLYSRTGGQLDDFDAHIKRIRQKLPQENVPWVLKTVYGVGYRFEVNA